MAENNNIVIVGQLVTAPRLTLDAADWDKKVFETVIAAERRSGVTDQLILKIPAAVIGSKKDLAKYEAGTTVIMSGEIQTEDVNTNSPTQARVRIFVTAEKLTKAEDPEPITNEVKLAGNICKDPRVRKTPRGTDVTDIMVAINGKSGSHYIPCICWQNVAEAAAGLKKGDYVEIEGRFQSRDYKKKIGSNAPFLMTAYEVSVIQLGTEVAEEELEARKKEQEAEVTE